MAKSFEDEVREAGLDPNVWKPVDRPAIIPGQGQRPLLENSDNKSLVASLPSGMQHDATFVKSGVSGKIPQLPLMPLGPSALPGINSAVISTASPTNVSALTAAIAALQADEAQDAATDGIINVRDLGYPFAGSGKQNYACGMVSNSKIVTLRLGTQSDAKAPITGGQLFEAKDVGKSILIAGPEGGAGASQIIDLWTTIVSVQSPTQATLADAAPVTGIATNFSGTAFWWDSKQDDTAIIQQAINACDESNQYSRVYLPAGVYLRTGTFTNSLNMKEMFGDGMGRTVILTKGPNVLTDACLFTDQVDFKMHDMTWRGPGLDATFGGRLAFDLFVESTLQNLNFENVEVSHVAFDAMFLNTAILSSWKNCRFIFNAGHGLNLNIAVAGTFENCYFIANLLAGCNMTGCAALAFNGCAAESNGIGYYMNGGTWAVSFNGVDSEFNTQRASKKPTSFPAVTVSGGGFVATGTYLLNYTWVRRVTNNSTPVESLPSPESIPVVVTGGNQTFSFTIPIAPTDVTAVKHVNIYATNAASGSEVFIGQFPLNPSATTTLTFNAPINLGSGIVLPVSSMVGHHYVVENSNNVSITGSTSNTTPCEQSRFLLVSGSSFDVSTRDYRLIQQTLPNPDFWIEVGPPGYLQTPSSRIHLECGDIVDAQVLIDPSTTSVIKWFKDIYQIPDVTLSNLDLPNAGVIKWGTDTGISRDSAGTIDVGNGTQGDFTGAVKASGLFAAGRIETRAAGVIGWSSTTDPTAAADTGLSRDAAGVVAVGNGTADDVSGTVKTAILNAVTGFKQNSGATSGHVLRGNGTNFVDAALAAADLSNGVTGSGAVVLASAPTISDPFIDNVDTQLTRVAAKVIGSGVGVADFSGSFQAFNFYGRKVNLTATGVMGFSSTSDPTGAADTGISRDSAGVIMFGNGTQDDDSATVAATVINAVTGFRQNNAAASGHVLRGNGTNFVDAALAAADLSNGVKGTGAVILATAASGLLNYQGAVGPTSCVNGGDTTIYTYTLPGGTIPAGCGVRVTCAFSAASATPTLNEKIFYGTGNLSWVSALQSVAQQLVIFLIMNDPSATGTQQIHQISAVRGTTFFAPNVGNAISVDSTTDLAIKITVNPSITVNVSGVFFLVELVRN